MIHVLGAGNIGSLFAVSLSRKFPVNFLLKPSTYKKFVDTAKKTVRIRSPSAGHAEWVQQIPGTPITNLEKPISHLVVAVKTYDIKKALHGIKHVLTPETEILILHNGMGIREEMQELWPSPQQRPQLGFGITDAGVKRNPSQWDFNYTGRGTCNFTMENENSSLANMLISSRELVFSEEIPADLFLKQQKRKLVVNSVINPLTAMLQCPNGALLSLDRPPHTSKLMQKVVNESCRVLDLDRYEMWDLLIDVAERTSSNLSSMLCDVEQCRPTEIDYINGYIVQEAQRKNIYAPFNLMLRDLVKMRMVQTRHEDESAIPLELDQVKF